MAKKKKDPSGYGEAEVVPSEILAQYVWGVFRHKKETWISTYHPSMTYPTLVKGNLTKEEAEKELKNG